MAEKSTKKTTTKRKTVSTARKASSTAVRPYKSNKPLISTGTIVTLVAFVLVIAAAVYINQKNKADAAAATPTPESINVFTEKDGTPTSIKIESADGQVMQIDLNDKKAWELTLPTKTEANQSQAEAAASQLSSLNIVRDITGAADTFGLDKPADTITAKFSDGKTHVLEIGDQTPTNSGYYVRLDKGKMMIVSLGGITALTQMVSAPPYLNTPTPTALPATATPVPVSETPASSPADTTATPTP